jgi:Icc-related predicted phosphoesterase
MPLFHFCGDPHSQFDQIIDAARAKRPDAIVLLGDLDLKCPLDEALSGIPDHTEVVWIPGNHDTDNDANYDNLFGSKYSGKSLHGRVTTVCGVKIAGLGGVFRGKIWDGTVAHFESQDAFLKACGKGNRWRGGLMLKHRSTIFPSDVKGFDGLDADVLVTHEAPDLHKLGSPVLSRLAESLRVKHAFHGHHHQTIEYPGGVWRGVGIRHVFELHL